MSLFSFVVLKGSASCKIISIGELGALDLPSRSFYIFFLFDSGCDMKINTAWKLFPFPLPLKFRKVIISALILNQYCVTVDG